MKRSIYLAGCVVLAACAVVGAPAWGQQKLGDKDADFVKEAALGNMMEVKLGQYALENAASPEVKKFAQRMVDDHTKANKELTTFATDKGVTVAKDLDKKCQEVCDKLTKLKGAEFDKEYMRHMLEDHEKDIAKFQEATKNLQDPDLRTWATKTLPTLNEHLRMAKDVHSKVEGK